MKLKRLRSCSRLKVTNEMWQKNARDTTLNCSLLLYGTLVVNWWNVNGVWGLDQRNILNVKFLILVGCVVVTKESADQEGRTVPLERRCSYKAELCFPGGSLVKEFACQRHRLDPWPRGIPHALEYWACVLEPVLLNKRSHCKEKPTHHNHRVACTRCN